MNDTRLTEELLGKNHGDGVRKRTLASASYYIRKILESILRGLPKTHCAIYAASTQRLRLPDIQSPNCKIKSNSNKNQMIDGRVIVTRRRLIGYSTRNQPLPFLVCGHLEKTLGTFSFSLFLHNLGNLSNFKLKQNPFDE